MKNLNEILKNSKNYLKQQNHKLASVEVSKGIQVCKNYHKEMNEQAEVIQGLKEKWNFKQNFEVQGKRLQYWSEKFWTLLEDNNLDLVLVEPINLEPLQTMILKNKAGNMTESVEYNY